MYNGHTIGVVVPSYNEAGFVGKVIETIPDYVDRVYVIDDCSTDETWAEIQRAATAVNGQTPMTDGERNENGHSIGPPATAENLETGFDRRIVPIQHDHNRGVGGAIKTGYLRARDDEIDITAVMAGDGQMDPDSLPRLLGPIVNGEADYTKGNRLESESYCREMPRFRLFGNTILTGLTKVASGYWDVVDPQNGYTAISHTALERLEIEAIYEYYGYPNDLLVRLNANRMRVRDVEIPAVYGDEESHITYPTYIWRLSGLLLRGFLWRLRSQYVTESVHPVVVCYLTGVLTSLAGILAGLRSVWTAGDTGIPAAESRRQPLVSIGLFLAGSGAIALAMVFDMRETEGNRG